MREITEFTNVGCVILSKNISPEIKGAFAAIAQTNVGSVLYLDDNDVVKSFNGVVDIPLLDENCVYILNGVGIMKGEQPKSNRFIANGVLLAHKVNEGKLNIEEINGACAYADFDEVKNFMGTSTVDMEFLSYMKPKTAFVTMDTLLIDSQVTLDALKEKVSYFVAMGTVVCNKNLHSYINANGTILGTVCEADE
jgi:hypothetical protein